MMLEKHVFGGGFWKIKRKRRPKKPRNDGSNMR